MGNSNKMEHRAFLLFLSLLVIVVLYIFSSFLNAIVLGIVLTVLFQPLHEKFLVWTRGRQNTSAILSVTVVFFFLILPFAILLTLITAQLGDLIAPQQAAETQPSVSEVIREGQNRLAFLGRKFEQYLGIQLQLGPMIRKGISELAQMLARYSPQVIAETANFFLHFFVMMIVLMYLFRDGKRLIAAMIQITPIKDTYEHKLAAEIDRTIHGIFYGSFITALIQAILATLIYYLLGIEGYLVWGTITFFMAFLPTIGTGAVVIPMVIALFLQGKPTHALILIICGAVIIGGIDNLLKPYLMRRNMHPIFLFLSVFGGLVAFGPIGLLLGPILMALLTATVRIYAKDFAGTTLPPTEPRQTPKDKKA